MSQRFTSRSFAPPGWSSVGKYLIGLMPFILVWLALAIWLTVLIYSRSQWSEQTDEAMVREWIEETRVFRKSLPELAREYQQLKLGESSEDTRHRKKTELEEQLRSMVEPTRAYDKKLPGFPVIFRLEVILKNSTESPEEISWINPLPHPKQFQQSQVRLLAYEPVQGIRILCEYQMHAFNKLQQREQERQRESWIAGVVLVTATLFACLFVYRFLRRDLHRETEQLRAMAEAEHRERELLENRVAREEAERSALELKSQLYASIGILAGSYAHNIKNLLVRPNDLLRRCLDTGDLSSHQSQMLVEVQTTLGTVTERLQQILYTVRRDATQSISSAINLTKVLQDTANTWTETAREKWKLDLQIQHPMETVEILGDPSNLLQVIENLIFNARDATFEMRNQIRELARQDQSPERKQKLLDAASWRGTVTLSLTLDPDSVVLEVTDNGIGMTDEVRQNCMKTHFTTKRDNALYEGYSAGMGLGLSFVAMVIETHRAKLEITSQPLRGTTFKIAFPRNVKTV